MPHLSGYTDWFSYSGHGDNNGLFCTDGKYLSPADLQNAFGANYNQFCAFIQACNSGIFPEQMSNGVVASACKDNELSFEDGTYNWGHGVFSYYLIQGLTNNLATGSDGFVSAVSLFNYASPFTTAYPPQQNAMHPQLANHYPGNLDFQQNVAVVLNSPSFIESGGSGATYKVDNTNVGTSWNGAVLTGHTITAVPPSGGTRVFVGWSDGNNDNPRAIHGSLNICATYKGIHLSSTAAAFTNNSQRKFVRTSDGWLHMVYESGGHVWLEHQSTNSGAAWQLNVDGNTNITGPLDIGAGKCPSMSFVGNTLAVVFEQQDGSNYKIILQSFVLSQDGTHYMTEMNYALLYPIWYGETSDSYTTDANPTIAWSAADLYFVVAFERKGTHPGLYYIYAGLNSHGDGLTTNPSDTATIPGTNANSIYASISTNGTTNPQGVVTFDVAWEQYAGAVRSDIWYAQLLDCSNYNPRIAPNNYPGVMRNISSASYYACSVRPSVVSLSDQTPRVSWVGDKDGTGMFYNVQAVETSPFGSPGYTALGAAVKSVSSRQLDNASDFYQAYSQNYPTGTWLNIASKGSALYTPKTLSTTGKDIQLCNGSSPSNIFLSSFYPFAAPYYFQTSQNLASVGLGKSSPTQMVYGRGVAIVKDELKYTYFFGNLVVDGSNIDFIDAPDSLQFDDLAVVNKVLESKPFTVTNQSTVTFCESSGFIDNTAAGQVLGSSGFIGSKIQLVDAITGNTIGTTRNIPAQSVNGSYGTLVPYSLSTNGIASKQVKVKITLSTNLEEAKSALIRSTSTVDLRQGLGKASTEQVAVLEMDLPSRFSLDQNYPNPFNPTTTIRYGLSTNAMVTLSVFNTLGQLVTTLVNEEERPGYHEVKFDGSNLASGVYFYRLSAGSFVQTRKLLLVR